MVLGLFENQLGMVLVVVSGWMLPDMIPYFSSSSLSSSSSSSFFFLVLNFVVCLNRYQNNLTR